MAGLKGIPRFIFCASWAQMQVNKRKFLGKHLFRSVLSPKIRKLNLKITGLIKPWQEWAPAHESKVTLMGHFRKGICPDRRVYINLLHKKRTHINPENNDLFHIHQLLLFPSGQAGEKLYVA